MGSIFFFSINSLLGLEYEGAEQGSSFMYFTILVFAFVLFFTILDIKKIRYRICYCIPIVFSIFFLVESATIQNVEKAALMKQSFSVFWAFSVPCIMVGTNLANTKETEKVFKWIDLLAFFISIGCIMSLPRLYMDRIVSIGGGNYQQLSYSAAFMFSIFLYNILNRNNCRFSFINNIYYTIITVFLMIGCVFCILASGGRGGFLLLMVNVIILCYSRRKWILKHSFFIILCLPLLFFVLSLFDIPIISVILDRGSGRIENTFFSDDGVSMSKSGREGVFEDALKYIDDNPWGYGFFRSYAIMENYPHNIFLEIILDGGYILLCLFILFLVRLYFNVLKMKKQNDNISFLLLLMSCPMVMLLATSTYLWNGLFWFGITYVFNYKNSGLKSVSI